MTVTSTAIIKNSDTHILGIANLTHAKGTEEVLFVAPMPSNMEPGQCLPVSMDLDSKAMYYSSPIVANTAFEDLSFGELKIAAFKGRDQSEMAAHLAKQAK